MKVYTLGLGRPVLYQDEPISYNTMYSKGSE